MIGATIEAPLDLAQVEPERRAAVALDAVAASARRWHRANRRPAALTAREALAALQFESLVVWVAARNVRGGLPLTDEDLQRLDLACQRIDAIAGEVVT